MSKIAPPFEAPLPAVGDSPTCLHSSSFISAAAVADVELTIHPDAADAAGDSPTCSHSSSLISAAADADVELTISPDAADAAVVAAVSKVSLSFYFHIII